MTIWNLQVFAINVDISSAQEYVVLDEVEMIHNVHAIPALILGIAPKVLALSRKVVNLRDFCRITHIILNKAPIITRYP